MYICINIYIYSGVPLSRDTILPWQGQKQNINQNLNLQITPHTLPLRASYGVSIVKIDRFITAPYR